MFSVRRIILSHTHHFLSSSLTSDLRLTGNYVSNIIKKRVQSYSLLKTIQTEDKKVISSSTTNDRGETLIFKAINPKSTKLTQLLVSVKSKRTRYSKQLILVEGKRLVEEALKAKVTPVMILFSRRNLIEGLPLDAEFGSPTKTVLHQIPYKDLKIWSDLTTSPGIFGIFKMPNLEKRDSPVDKLPITIVCDNVREPGNLGSVFRIAAALPVERVILVSGCTDLWDSKVIRSSSGAMFYLNVTVNASWDDVMDRCSGNILLADHLPSQKSSCAPVPCENIVEEEDVIYEDYSSDVQVDSLRDSFKLPTKSCFDAHINSEKRFVIVVGGETQGLSENAFQLAASRNGYRVNIPLSECVDSLNAGAALGIISFELKRQLMLHQS